MYVILIVDKRFTFDGVGAEDLDEARELLKMAERVLTKGGVKE